MKRYPAQKYPCSLKIDIFKLTTIGNTWTSEQGSSQPAALSPAGSHDTLKHRQQIQRPSSKAAVYTQYFVLFTETESHSVAQIGLELTTAFLPQPPKC